MAISYTPAVANQRPAGFKRVFIKTGSELWQSLGFIKDGELSFSTKSEADSLMRNLAYCAEFKATFKMLQTDFAASHEIKLMDAISDGSNSFLFELSDNDTTYTNDNYVLMSNTQVGAKAKLVIDGDPNSIRYIEVEVSGSVLLSLYDEAINPTVVSGDFIIAGSSGTYGQIGSTGSDGAYSLINLGHKSRMLPAGITSVQLQDANATGYDTIGKLKNAKMEFDFVVETDSQMRPQSYAVDISVEYEHLETLKVGGLDQLGVWAGSDIDVKITCFDGMVVTLASKLGFEANYSVSGNMDKFAVVKHTHKGRIAKSSFDAMFA